MKFTAEPFPFFDDGVSYSVNYYPKNGAFASEPLIACSGTGLSPNESNASAESLRSSFFARRTTP